MRLEVERLGFGYPGRVVGRDVSFALGSGEVLCLLGPNGGGKTTLFKTILGLLPAQAGTVRLDGADAATLSRDAVARVIGYVPQAHTGYFPFAVRDIVLMGRTAHFGLFAAPSRRDRVIAEQALERMGIGDLIDRVYTEISGGQRQLVLIARALAQEPRILVMDEPTASLDFGNQVRVLNQLSALAADGIAIILSTHDPDQAFLCADRVAMLHDGHLARLGPPNEVITRMSLREVYGVDIDVIEVDRPAGGRTRVCVPSLSDVPRRPAPGPALAHAPTR